jgi:NAD(P)-dependent dehydrogenase (short-subunit alcohol dehydrogenase family)
LRKRAQVERGYGATKAALASLTRSWAAEFSPRGVRVNAVAPGPAFTEYRASSGRDIRCSSWSQWRGYQLSGSA